ncbi:kynurenine 3-monooxygenase [Octopus bimaculoides]|uniref:Kynurenine 3-monooxygenase n=1 Tax=Octopus bimaculoides TaxID=37653 RepID=A0A0L8H1W3_OCTBM|nr:kynurenine 3-monooxygenase [Octopus bimaculoides]|eukprot:XP_014776105.1 PREDICTED: kynurenine 3-monooxygenase-like [Octopus bimaculoides]
METNDIKHVAIIGGGLVGSLNACFMAKRGFKVSLYELRKDIRKEAHVSGRSINLALSERGLSALNEVGLREKVRPFGIPMYARMIHNRDSTKRRIPYGRENQFIMSIDRRKLNELLLTVSESQPNVELHFEHKLKQCSFNGKPKAIFETPSKETVEQDFDVVFGNDGAFSAVRNQIMKTTKFDFQQKFIPHGYMELSIPPNEEGQFAMESNCLHIWPRDEFMMISLPNLDKSFTTTLFMPFELFETLHTKDDLLNFFEKTFPDSLPLIGRKSLVETFFSRKALPMVTVKCHPYNVGGKAAIMGDAAHAMVPFYGQGMNAGFEDCIVMSQFLDEYKNDFDEALPKYTEFRHVDAVSICDLAMYNYVEMRSLVNSKLFLVRKLVDNLLNKLFPHHWIPLYSMVSFSRIRYHECIAKKKWQDQLLLKTGKLLTLVTCFGTCTWMLQEHVLHFIQDTLPF